MTKNILVAYYSWSGRTKQVAEEIAQKVSGDLVEIKVPENTFSTDMYETFDISKRQMAENSYPEIELSNTNFDNYDEIFVGSPVWGGMPATPIYTFLKQLKANDYSGKVASFYTDVGSVGNYDETFKQWARGLDVLNSGQGDSRLNEWL